MVSKNGQPTSEDLRRNGVGEKSMAKDSKRRYSPKCAAPQKSNGHCLKSPSGGHWWMIESQSGPTSEGICKFCGATKDFANSADIGIRKAIDSKRGTR